MLCIGPMEPFHRAKFPGETRLSFHRESQLIASLLTDTQPSCPLDCSTCLLGNTPTLLRVYSYT